MAVLNVYQCMDCGMQLEDDGRVFIWDGDSNETKDFMILMGNCHWLHDAEIRGDVSITWCGECEKYLKIYWKISSISKELK